MLFFIILYNMKVLQTSYYINTLHRKFQRNFRARTIKRGMNFIIKITKIKISSIFFFDRKEGSNLNEKNYFNYNSSIHFNNFFIL